MSALPPPLPDAPAAADLKNDFADWLSPILVKELRQGLRTRVFTSTFILLQLVLTGCVFIGLLVAANGGNTGVSSGFFWTLVALPLVLILPWTGLGAISGEYRANTLDLMFLTRLSAWRILLGKWIAIVAQAALLLAAVLPYVVLRYFMGGVNLGAELTTLVILFALSALLSAILVGISAYPGRLMRVLVVIGMLLGMQMLLPMALFMSIGPAVGVSGMPHLARTAIAIVVVMLAVVAMLALNFGAARIAPPAENHAARKRLMGFVLLALAAAAAMWDSHAQPVTILALVATVPILVGALCEEPTSILSIYAPFARRGWLGRMLGRVLYPGWPAGVLCAVLMLGGFGALFAAQHMFKEWWAPIAYIAFCGALLVPAAMFRLLRVPARRMILFYIGAQAACIFLGMVLRIIDSVTDSHVAEVLFLLPTSALFVLATGGVRDTDAAWFGSGVAAATGLAVLVLLVFTGVAFRRMAALERESLSGRSDGVA
jgi:ABC-type transport system involved in multi-copper enzyme maturation permease subunit